MSHYEIEALRQEIKSLEARLTELARDFNGLATSQAETNTITKRYSKDAHHRIQELEERITNVEHGPVPRADQVPLGRDFATPLATAMAQMELDGHVETFEANPTLENAAVMFDAALQMHVEQMIEDEAFRIIVKRIARFAPNGGDEK